MREGVSGVFLRLVVDKDASFGVFQEALARVELGGVPAHYVRDGEPLAACREGTLLDGGDSSSLIVRRVPADDVKRFSQFFGGLVEGGDVARAADPGLLIVCECPRTSTRKLEKMVRDAGGDVVVMPKPARGRSVADELLDCTGLSAEAKRFLRGYAGEDFQVIVPVLSQIMLGVERGDQHRISVDNLTGRLLREGSLKPWLVEEPIFRGDGAEALRVCRRVLSGGVHPLAVAKILEKMGPLSRAASLLQVGCERREVAQVLGLDVSSYQFRVLFDRARALGVAKCRMLSDVSSQLSRGLKSSTVFGGEELLLLLVPLMADVVAGRVCRVPRFVRDLPGN